MNVFLELQPGSSPLARGLLGVGGLRLLSWRIIPARAGFTSPAWRPAEASRDHPRSRGVYHVLHAVRYPTRGSSPLARGLPELDRCGFEGQGIIPARAGFTWLFPIVSCRRWDHPRSRGVYFKTLSGIVVFARIIPARAGFTLRPVASALQATDHPRSRGVYSPPWTRTSPASGSSPLARGLRCGRVG